MYSVVLSERADRDIEDIRQYIAYVLLNPTSAEKIVAEIYNKLKTLKFFPMAAAIYAYEPWKSRKARCIHVRHYRIFYNVLESQKRVYIIRIAYSGFNPETLATK